jgi:ABC-2 type transport system permease protein
MSGGSLAGLDLMVRKELREHMRTLRLPVVVILFALLGLLSPLMARYIREIITAAGAEALSGVVPDPVVGDAVIQFTKNLGQFGVLAAVLVTMGSVASEKERGTAAFLLTKPVSRGAFLGGKAIGLGALLAVATLVAGVLCWVYTAILFEPLAIGGFAAAIVVVWLSLSVFATITFLASVVARSALVAGGIGIAALLATGILSALPVVGPYLPTSLWGLADQLAIGSVPDPLLGPVLANVTVVVVLVAASWAAFARQEL